MLSRSNVVGGPPDVVQSLYNTPCYIMDLDITLNLFYQGILQRNYREMVEFLPVI